MSKRILMAFLAALAMSAQASPITFFDTRFDVTAVALTDGAPGFDTQSSPPGATPVSASAGSVGATDVATAGAIGGPGVLTTSADVSASSGIASAVATSYFSGSFFNLGPVILNVDFLAVDFAQGTGSGATSLFVSVVSGGLTMFEDFISGPWEFQYVPVVLGSTSVLALTLSSEASAGFPAAGVGGASSFGLVTFAGTVPAPATWLLVMIALAALVAASPRPARRWLVPSN